MCAFFGKVTRFAIRSLWDWESRKFIEVRAVLSYCHDMRRVAIFLYRRLSKDITQSLPLYTVAML